jgi:type IV pilus assembly protein PilQ
MRWVAAIALLGALAGPAHADDFCPRQGRGASISLSVRNADIHEVLRLLADAGKKDVVIPDSVQGTVTVQLKDVPWDSAVCTVAALLSLRIEVNGKILLVTKR